MVCGHCSNLMLDLYEFLKEIQIEENFTKFLKEELFVDVLTEVDDPILDSSLVRADVNLSAGNL